MKYPVNALYAPSPIPAINHASIRLARDFQKKIFELRRILAHELTVPPEKACRFVSLTPSGHVEVRRLSQHAEIPAWSLTNICAHDVLSRNHRISPRREDIIFLTDLSGRVRLTRIPNVVRNWVEGGHFTGIYEGLSPSELIALIGHYHSTLDVIPHQEAYLRLFANAVKATCRKRVIVNQVTDPTKS